MAHQFFVSDSPSNLAGAGPVPDRLFTESRYTESEGGNFSKVKRLIAKFAHSFSSFFLA
jgi:hypothetical protein